MRCSVRRSTVAGSDAASAVLLLLADAVLAMGADQIDASLCEPVAQHIAVGRLVVDKLGWDAAGHRLVQQWLDEIHLGHLGRLDFGRQRKALGVGEYHDLGPLAAFGRADAIPPFFAGANVPSAKPSSQSILPALSSKRTNRR